MKYIILSFLFIYLINSTVSQDQNAYTIWNSNNSSNFGIINLDTANITTTLQLDNILFVGGSTSTFNSYSNVLYALVKEVPSNGYQNIVSVYVDDMQVIGNVTLCDNTWNVFSLVSDQTSGVSNIFFTYNTESSENTFIIGKVSPLSGEYSTFDNIQGQYLTSTYDWSTTTYIVTYVNTSGTFVNEYSQSGIIQSSKLFKISNLAYGFIQTSPLTNMVFVPKNNMVLLSACFNSSIAWSAPDVLFFKNSVDRFSVSGWIDQVQLRAQTNEIHAITSHYSKTLVYLATKTLELNKFASGFTITTIDYNLNQFTYSSNELVENILNFWSFQ